MTDEECQELPIMEDRAWFALDKVQLVKPAAIQLRKKTFYERVVTIVDEACRKKRDEQWKA